MNKKIISSVLTAAMSISLFSGLTVTAQNSVLDSLTLPYTADGYKIAGNITLPEEVDGQAITWSASPDGIIKTTAGELTEDYGENYTNIPAGVVTRPTDSDRNVTLTATVGSETKDFNVVVKKAPEKNYEELQNTAPEDGGFTGYLYASFIEPSVDKEHQQTFFASSDDGRNWTDLNDNEPVLTSTMGTEGLRDHYIIRSPEGDRFYLLATDLDCTSGDWRGFSTNGSKSIMVWESDDLVNWSEQRMVQVADLDGKTSTGCVWAPEAIYDKLTGEYIMYWSGEDLNEGSESKGKKVVYYSKTRDFRTFTPQKQFVYPLDTDGTVANTSRCFIDTTMIQGSDGLFYRTTKYEETNPLHVFVDVAQYPLGEFKRVKTNLEETDFLGTEGPGWFKFNKDDTEETGNKYCLMLDGYGNPNRGVGFFPNTIPDLNNTWESIVDGTAELSFTRVKSNYKMRSYAKHGGIIQLTQEEYDRVNTAYASKHYKQYLTSDKCVTSSNITDWNNNTQIRIAAGKTARMVIKSDELSKAKSALVSYAQNGGTFNVKLYASDTANGNGEEIASFSESPAANYDTRNSTEIALDAAKTAGKEYLIVEMTCSGSKDGYSYIDYVELRGVNGEYTAPTPAPTQTPVATVEPSDKEYGYSEKQYLTSPYCVTATGAGNQTNASLGGTPQINVASSAKLVIKSENLKYMEGACVSYAQNGGTLTVKLSAADTADTTAEEIAVFNVTAASDYDTRKTDIIDFDRSKIGDKEYLIVEISCTSTSYIDFVELFSTVKQTDRLKMNTTFKKAGADIISASANDTVTASTTVENRNVLDRTLEYYVTAYDAQGNAVGEAVKADTKTITSYGTATLTAEITVGSQAAYYNFTVKDVTSADRTQTMDAGYLPIGDTLTKEMIYGAYDVDGSELVISKNDTVSLPNVTVGGKTYTAVKDGNTISLKNGDNVYAIKDNAAADYGYLTCEVNAEPISVKKSTGGNPIIRDDGQGNRIFSGDPAATVIDTDGDKVGDTVYLITGHDVSRNSQYRIPEWLCYTSKDMVNWKYEGVAFNSNTIPWRRDDTTAWASQMIEHYDETANKNKYYFYFCTLDAENAGRHSIGVAVADKPEGPYVPMEHALVPGTLTASSNETMGHADIDPTVWVETVDGVEHRYLVWGNTYSYICELNEDMISVKDINGDGQITYGDDGDVKSNYFELRNGKYGIVNPSDSPENLCYTEAPWIYRRQDADGKYYGKYYLFGAWGWYEAMAYATSDSIWGPWEFGEVIMDPTATSNTNHPSIIDFKGKTYFIYHNGMMPWGSGYRRSVCATELEFNDDGSVKVMEELSIGLDGFTSTITTKDGKYIGHDHYTNPYVEKVPGFDPSAYPLRFEVKEYNSKQGYDTEWELEAPLYTPTGEKAENYISIQSANKPGLYITTEGNKVTLMHDDNDNTLNKDMTFKTVKALDGSEGVSFESASAPGKYLAMRNGDLILSEPWILSECVFNIASQGRFTKDAVNINSENNAVEYDMEYEAPDGAVLYTALYDEEGMLLACDMNNTSGVFDIPESGRYTFKAFLWEDMQPLCSAVEKELIIN